MSQYKTDQLNKYIEKRLIKIDEKDIEKAFKHKVVKEDKVWVIRHKGTELRNPVKKEAIRDWYTINGYLVEDK